MRNVLPLVSILKNGNPFKQSLIMEVTPHTIIVVESCDSRVYYDRRTGVCKLNPQHVISPISLANLDKFLSKNGTIKQGAICWKSKIRLRKDSAGKVNFNIQKSYSNMLSWLGLQKCGFVIM